MKSSVLLAIVASWVFASPIWAQSADDLAFFLMTHRPDHVTFDKNGEYRFREDCKPNRPNFCWHLQVFKRDSDCKYSLSKLENELDVRKQKGMGRIHANDYFSTWDFNKVLALEVVDKDKDGVAFVNMIGFYPLVCDKVTSTENHPLCENKQIIAVAEKDRKSELQPYIDGFNQLRERFCKGSRP